MSVQKYGIAGRLAMGLALNYGIEHR